MRDTCVLPTIVIWLAVTGIVCFIIGALAVTRAEIEWWGAVLLLILVIAGLEEAAKSTQAIWRAERHNPAAKTKREQRDRLTRLVDSLGDDDIYELEAMLLARDHPEVYDNGSHS